MAIITTAEAKELGIVYLTQNMVNKKIYIGYTIRKEPYLSSYLGSGMYLKRAINKYGKHNFVRETLEKCESICELKKSEKYWIKFFGGVKNTELYNLTEGGDGLEGYICSDETRKKISKANIGKKMSIEARKKISNSMKGKEKSISAKKNMMKVQKGKKISLESRKRMSIARTGRKLSDTHKENLSKSRRGEKNHNYGIPLSEETKKKISETKKGSKASEATKEKMRESRKNVSAETREKMSIAQTGRKHTEESKEKMRKSWIIRKGKRL